MAEKNLEFLEIYNAFQPRIFRYLTRLVGEHEAKDLTQDVFMKVNNSLKTFRGESQLSTWIYRIATNTALDRLRNISLQQRGEKKLLSDSTEEEKDGNILAREKTPSVEKQLIKKEMNECIRGFIEGLPDNYRTAIILSELEGLQNSEIAEVLGLSLEVVKARLHRARNTLKKILEARCSIYRDERNELACDLKSAFRELKKVY